MTPGGKDSTEVSFGPGFDAKDYIAQARRLVNKITAGGIGPGTERELEKLKEARKDFDLALAAIEDEDERADIREEADELLAHIRTTMADRRKKVATKAMSPKAKAKAEMRAAKKAEKRKGW